MEFSGSVPYQYGYIFADTKNGCHRGPYRIDCI